MVQVQVLVSHLAIEVDGEQIVFRTGECFEIPAGRAIALGTSVKILDIPPVMPEPEPNPPDIEPVLEIQKPKSNSRRRR
jgi:hypothetical protein